MKGKHDRFSIISQVIIAVETALLIASVIALIYIAFHQATK